MWFCGTNLIIQFHHQCVLPRLSRRNPFYLGKIDPIVLAGLFHRQCVIVHPFIDGNGRTTRLLTTAILGKGGLDLFEIFSFENYYNQNITLDFEKQGVGRGTYYVVKVSDYAQTR